MRAGRSARCGPVVLALLAGCASTPSTAATSSTSLSPEAVSRPAATPLVLRGEQLLSEGKVTEARKVFEEAVSDDPQDARAWLDLGLSREGLGEMASAQTAYRRAVEIDPAFPDPLNNLGVLLREEGKLDEAITVLERAVAIDPRLAAARFNLALAYEDKGRRDDAEREYLATIEQLPADPVPRINLAMMLLDVGRTEDAAVHLRAAAPMVRHDVLLSIAVGEGLRRARLPEEALPVLQNALQIASAPPPTELLAELALTFYAQGDLESADATMARAVHQDELDPALQYAYGSILAKRGKIGKARAHLRRAIELDPKGPYAGRARARLESLK
jgi:superkiller protein 3